MRFQPVTVLPRSGAMNFFETQDRARRRTKWLVVYFIFAVISIVLSVYFGVIFGMKMAGAQERKAFKEQNLIRENPGAICWRRYLQIPSKGHMRD